MIGAQRRSPPRLLALSPGDLTEAEALRVGSDSLLARVVRAREAGLTGVLLREPNLADGALLSLARALIPALGPDGWLGVHDRLHVALAAGASGAHVGFRSLPPVAARGVLGDGIALGFSSHADDAPESWAGADYLFHGPVFPTSSKVGLIEPVGLGGLERFVHSVDLPVHALGGLTPESALAILAAGAAGLAVRGALLGSSDPAAATAAFLDVLDRRR